MQPSKCPVSVQNGTEIHAFQRHYVPILTRKNLTKLEIATRGGISEEMARPRTAMSARIAELNMTTGRNPARPSTGTRGKINEVIHASRKSRPETASTAATIPGKCRVRDCGIGNALIDGRGRAVKLKKGAHLEIIVTSKDFSGRE
jgi:hypothetical protein